METRRVLFLNEAHPILAELLTAAGFVCDFDYQSSKDEVAAKLAGYVGIVTRSRFDIDRSLLERGEQLAFVAREGVGTEHIDLAFAAKRGITVLTSPEGSRDTVAEHAMGLLLMLLNKLGVADRQMRKGHRVREGNRGRELKGKTVGIIGYGNMGTAMARRLSGFGVRVLAYDKFRRSYGDDFAEAVDLPTLQRESDIISLHIPYSADNHYFVDGDFLAAFAKPIYIVNTARGLVLDTAALVAAMQAGRVLGAALDVLEYEEGSFERMACEAPPPPLAWLMASDAAVLSPHIAGWSFESKEGHARVLANKILVLMGEGVLSKSRT